jgi:hypothetical protein
MAFATNPDLTVAVFTAEPGSKSEVANHTEEQLERRELMLTVARPASSTPAVELAIHLRDLGGMTEDFGALPRHRTWVISSTFTSPDGVRHLACGMGA